MPDDREEMQRRRDREEMEARGRVGAMFIIFFFLVVIPAWVFVGWYFLGLFRTTPLKGTKHPNKTGNSTNGTDAPKVTVALRWWVYQHPPTNTSRFSQEEEAFRKKREEVAKRVADMEAWYIEYFENWYALGGFDSPELLGGRFYSTFLQPTSSMWMVDGPRLTQKQAVSPPSDIVQQKVGALLHLCVANSTDCNPRIFGHLHYGADPNKYYDVRNAIFLSKRDGFVRVFVIDVARSKLDIDGSSDDFETLALFNSEKPLTDSAWHVDPDYPDTEDAMEVTVSLFKNSTIVYDGFFPPILSYLHGAMDGMIGLRFTEFVGVIHPPIVGAEVPEVGLVHGDTHVFFTKEKMASKKVRAVVPPGESGSLDPVGSEKAIVNSKDEF
jgi:hypothetical protein